MVPDARLVRDGDHLGWAHLMHVLADRGGCDTPHFSQGAPLWQDKVADSGGTAALSVHRSCCGDSLRLSLRLTVRVAQRLTSMGRTANFNAWSANSTILKE